MPADKPFKIRYYTKSRTGYGTLYQVWETRGQLTCIVFIGWWQHCVDYLKDRGW